MFDVTAEIHIKCIHFFPPKTQLMDVIVAPICN